MHHTYLTKLGNNKRSFAFVNRQNPEVLVIFIHGFTGDASLTWDKFPQFIRSKDDLADSDVLFYDYDSTKSQVNYHALDLFKTLTALLDSKNGRSQVLRADTYPSANYSKIILVAHSMGAIITRRALLFAKKQNTLWLSLCDMVLFAPAHCGALKNFRLLGRYPLWLEFIRNYVLDKRPVIEQLVKGSTIINELKTDTEKYLANNDGEFTKAKIVIWAQHEYVVEQEDFCSDPVPEREPGTDHASVCKPDFGSFKNPYNHLLKLL